MERNLSKTRHRIALFFSLSAGGFILMAGLITIILLSYTLDKQAYNHLQKNLAYLEEDFQNQQLQNIGIHYQTLNTSPVSSSQQTLPNINDTKTINPSAISRGKTTESNITKQQFLQEQESVFSRIILENGDIFSTSDLFENYTIDPYQEGFRKEMIKQVCLYSLTSKNNAGSTKKTIFQVAQYCSFTPQQERQIFFIILGGSIVLSFFTYFVGQKIGKSLLKPLQKNLEQTKAFAQNCYHELLTPLSVALTTIAATHKTKNYQQGIISLEEDLKKAH